MCRFYLFLISPVQKKVKLVKKLVPWEPFQYHSRGETGKNYKDVILTHVRPRDDPNRERNVFLRYKEPTEFAHYSDAEYNKLLQSNAWSREQTDELMRLCDLVEARLYVVWDRWDEDRFGKKTYDDIRARFYEIQAALTGNTKQFHFDMELARVQRRQAEILYNRTGHEVWEEYEARKEYADTEAELQKARLAPSRVRAIMEAFHQGGKDPNAAAKV